jgi:hypothetical protein
MQRNSGQIAWSPNSNKIWIARQVGRRRRTTASTKSPSHHRLHLIRSNWAAAPAFSWAAAPAPSPATPPPCSSLASAQQHCSIIENKRLVLCHVHHGSSYVRSRFHSTFIGSQFNSTTQLHSTYRRWCSCSECRYKLTIGYHHLCSCISV